MPCFLTGSREGDLALTLSEARAEATRLARLLCEAVELINLEKYRVSPELRAWIEEHSEIDRKRKEKR